MIALVKKYSGTLMFMVIVIVFFGMEAYVSRNLVVQAKQAACEQFEKELVYAMVSSKVKHVGRFWVQKNAAGATVLTFDDAMPIPSTVAEALKKKEVK